MKKCYFQTGDILYKTTDLLPKDAEEISGNIIHKGNDHLHSIEGDYQLYLLGNEMFILAKDTCNLNHEEHKTIKLPKGLYKKEIVLEYDHWLEESRNIID